MTSVTDIKEFKTECVEENDDVEFIDFSINAEHFSNFARESSAYEVMDYSKTQQYSSTMPNFRNIQSAEKMPMNYHTKIRYRPNPSVAAVSTTTTKLPCPKCHLKFKNEESLVSHVTRTHTEAYMCRKCSKSCQNYAELNRHHLEYHVSLRGSEEEVILQKIDQVQKAIKETVKNPKKSTPKQSNKTFGTSHNVSAKRRKDSPPSEPPVPKDPPPTAPTAIDSLANPNPNNVVVYVVVPPGVNANSYSTLMNTLANQLQLANSQPPAITPPMTPQTLTPENMQIVANNLSYKLSEQTPVNTLKEESDDDDDEEEEDDLEIIEASPVEYNCVKCSMNFQNKSKFDYHMELHYNAVNHGCDKCTKTFKLFRDYLVHSCVRKSKQFMCTECGRYFCTVSKLRKHMLNHGGPVSRVDNDEREEFMTNDSGNKSQSTQITMKNDSKTYNCAKCACLFTCYMTMRRHLKKCDVTIFTCPICRRFYRQKVKLEKHMSVCHGPSKHLECDICKCSFKSEVTFKRHQFKHKSNQNVFRCPTCYKIFRLRHNLDYHMTTAHVDRPFKCDVCGAFLTSLTHVKSHFTKKHKTCDLFYSLNNPSPNAPNSGKVDSNARQVKSILPKRKAPTITNSSPNYNQLVANVNVKLESDSLLSDKHGLRNEAGPQILCSYSIPNSNQSRFSCHLCSQTFQFKHRLKYHLLNLHNSSRPVKCGSCSKYFQTVKRFNQHQCSGSSPKFKLFNN